MLRSIESTGKTVDEAIYKGLSEIKLSIDEVDIEVIQNESKGILGIGRKDAKVRLTQKPEDKIIIPDFTELARKPQREISGREKKPQREQDNKWQPKESAKPRTEKPQAKEQPKPHSENPQLKEQPKPRTEKPQLKEQPKPRTEKPQLKEQPKPRGEKSQQNQDKGANTPQHQEKRAKELNLNDIDPSLTDNGDESIVFTPKTRPEREEKRYSLDDYGHREPTKADIEALKKHMAKMNYNYVDESLLVIKEENKAENKTVKEAASILQEHQELAYEPEEEELIATLENTEKEPGAIFLRDLLTLMGVDAVVRTASRKDDMTIQIDSESMALIIGHRGETLDALQYITSLVVNKDRKDQGYRRVSLDTEGYRHKREATLSKLAKRVAQQVRQSGKARTMEPMNPYERRIFHSTLQSNPYVTTHSEGVEPNRRVVISPKNRKRNYNNKNRQKKSAPETINNEAEVV